MQKPSCHHVVTCALLLHDLGWVTAIPEIGIPALMVGLSLLAYMTLAALRAKDPDLYCHASIFFWLVGNVLWTIAEYIWDHGHPVGFLAHIDFITSLDKKWYSVMMLTGLIVQILTCLGLIAFYARYLLRWRSYRNTVVARAASAQPLVGVSAVAELAYTAPRVEPFVAFPWLPLRMYYELFTLPWILMDTLWVYFDWVDITEGQSWVALIVLSGCFGAAAVALNSDSVRRLFASQQRSEALLALAEVIWIAGNVSWMLEDALTDSEWMYTLAILLFAGGPFVVACSLFVKDQDETSAEELRTARDIEADAALLATVVMQPVHASVAAAEPEAAKKRRHSWHERRFSKRVTILPKDLSHQTPDFPQSVARLALNALKEPDTSITLLNIGEVNKRLVEWKKLLPRMHLYYAVCNHADKRTAQLLCQSRCCFACTTPEEVKRVLSFGASPEDVLFYSAHKVRSHLSYMREKGVRLMPFDDEAELRKIAAEYPSARLLLQLASPKNTTPKDLSRDGVNLSVQFGASRSQWEPLLMLAADLGVEVVGVSLRTRPGGENWASADSALQDAAEVFALAIEKGHAMEVLDVGSGVASDSIGFSNAAAILQRDVSQYFPVARFPSLRVIASPGEFFLQSASMLLTQVVAKEVRPQGDPSICYVLNAGLYSGFASLLANQIEPELPLLVAEGATERPVRRCCFLGPSRTQLDVVLKDAAMPELEEGEWIIWPGFCAPHAGRSTSPVHADDEDFQHSQSWFYAEDGSLDADF
jgi:ornithine decarboxylase